MVFAITLIPLSMLQLGLAFGAPWGNLAWGGEHRVLPVRLRIGSAAVLVLYAAFALVILDRADGIDALPEPVATVGTWVVFGIVTLSTAANAVSRSTPERWTGTPAALILAVTSLIVALG